MKLLTHNLLQCHIKGVKNGYPLKIEATKVESRDADYDPDFLRSMFGRLNWAAFLEGARALGVAEGLPLEVTDAQLQDDAFLQLFHHALLEVYLEEGALVCPETGRRFVVTGGIPNMLLNEDEIVQHAQQAAAEGQQWCDGDVLTPWECCGSCTDKGLSCTTA